MATDFPNALSILASWSPRFALIAGAIWLCGCHHTPPVLAASTRCNLFSGPPKSGLAWQSARDQNGLRGHVLRLVDLKPVQLGRVRIEPGGHRTFLDTAGFFRFANLPVGRYQLTVDASGYPTVSDSIVLGGDGLIVLATVGEYAGDIVLTCPASGSASRPSNER